jgi:general secretion pathway protein G
MPNTPFMLSEQPRPQHGFTLLELLVVLVILGLLAGIAGATYFSRIDGARLQKVDADFGTIAAALSLYRLDAGALPTTAQGLQALVTQPTQPPRPTRYKPGGYLDELPLDPWGNAYLYLQPARAAEREYDLYSLGADGEPGGEGNDADLMR